MKGTVLVVFGIIFGLFSCKDDPIEPKLGSVKFSVNYVVNSEPLQFDTITYTNAAGHKYGLTHLEYYISNIAFNKSDGSSYSTNAVFYINAQKPETNFITIDNIPKGNYTSVTFYTGLDSILNKTNALPNTLDNINMAWPDAMGGGYHFMKMEGYFLAKANQKKYGYAMHLGKNPNLVKAEVVTPISIDGDMQNKTLTMNINEWYANPAVYDFEVDGNYSMGLSAAMLKLSKNGKDVFSIK